MYSLIGGWVLFGGSILFSVLVVLLKIAGLTEKLVLLEPKIVVITMVALVVGFVLIGKGVLSIALP